MVQIPAYSSSTNSDITSSVQLTIDLDGRNVIFVPITKTFLYTAPPNGTAIATAITDSGDLQSGMSGGTRVTVSISNFVTVYRASDIRVTFGFAQPLQVSVSRLRASDKSMTRFELMSPSSITPGAIRVTITTSIQPSNIGQFDLVYMDDRIPEVLDGYEPYLHYATGGSNVTATVTLLDGVPLSSLQMVFRQGTSYTVESQPLAIESIPTSANGAVRLTFGVPAGSPGLMSVRIRVRTATLKTTSTFSIELVSVPTAPPILLAYSPSTGPNTGGTVVSMILKNMLAVTDSSQLRVQVSLGNVESTLAFGGDIVFLESTILQTSLRFRTPSFTTGGDGVCTVYALGRESFNATVIFRYIDVSVAQLLYAYPSVGKANLASTIEVSVARFGAISGPTGISVRTGPGITTTLSIVSYQPRRDGSTMFVISAARASGLAGALNISVSNCPSFAVCPDKTVTFPYFFRDPFRPYILSYSPAFAFSDGRTPIFIQVEYLPVTVDPSEILVPFGLGNMTQISITRSAPNTQNKNFSNAVIAGLIPTFTPAGGYVQPVMRISASEVLDFPSPFQYLMPPNPSVVDVQPMAADVLSATPVQITLEAFPGVEKISGVYVLHVCMCPRLGPVLARHSMTAFAFVLTIQRYYLRHKHGELHIHAHMHTYMHTYNVHTHADLVVDLRWPDNTIIRASVVSFTSLQPSKYPTDVQDVRIQIETPIGSSVRESVVDMRVTHTQFPQRNVLRTGFRMIDATSPAVSGLTSEGYTGQNNVLIRASQPSEVTLLVSNARAALSDVLVGSTPVTQDLLLSQYNPSLRTAKAVWMAPASPGSTATVQGLVRFGRSCGASCVPTCCASVGGCSTVCSCMTSCFSMTYFDNLQPIITFNTPLRGPESGDTEIRMTISNLPRISTGAEATLVFDSSAFGQVFVVSSTAQETSLQMFTPAVPDMRGFTSRSVPVTLTGQY